MNIPLSPCVPENLVSRDGFFSRPAPRFFPSSPASFIYVFKHPYAIGSVPSLSGHAIAYRWRSLPRVRRHRASKPQGSSKRVLPWQITMDQLIYASLSHTHYWYEVIGGCSSHRMYRMHSHHIHNIITDWASTGMVAIPLLVVS